VVAAKGLVAVHSSAWFGSCGWRDTLLGKFDQEAESFINRCSVWKHLGHVLVKRYQIGTFPVCLEMLTTNTPREIILWADVVFFVYVLIMIHSACPPAALLAAQ